MTQYARYPTVSVSVGAVNQGTPNTIANAWPVKPTDGTNSQSYTAAGEAKVSVTQPLPAGTNVIGAVTQSGTWTTGRTWTLAFATDKVDVSGSTVAATQSGAWTVAATQSGAWSTGRTWTLSNATDSVAVSGTVAATQSGAWTVAATQSGAWSTGRTWTLASGTDSVTVTGTVAATQSGTWTTGRTWALASGTDSVAAVQSGTWTTGRTWNLSSGADSVAAVQSGAWTVSGTGSAGSAATGVVTVQGIAGAVAVITDQTSTAPTFQAEGAIAFGALTTTYATLFTAAGNTRILMLRNSMDQNVLLSWDASTTHYLLEPGDALSFDFRANGTRVSTGGTLSAKYTGTAPTSGTVRANGVY